MQLASRLAVLSLCALLATTAAHAACQYRRVGRVPVAWKDQRLMLAGTVNGTPVDMLVDTGSAAMQISRAFAEKLGLGLWPVSANGVRLEEAGRGGRSELWRARVDEISFGQVQWKGAHLAVFDGVSGAGKGPDVLVGAGFLLQRDAELTADAITFFEPADCGPDASLAYWGDPVPWTATEATKPDDLRAVVTVLVDGHPVRALVDSGAPTSVIDLPVARALGFDPAAAASQAGRSGGIGSHTMPTWPATFQTFEIGDEVIRHPRLRVEDMYGAVRTDFQFTSTEKELSGQAHMLLGADFLQSHRVLFATSQRRIYFSYLGGPVFGVPGEGATHAGAAASAVAAR
jgi:predicted aspartyl protease